MADVVYGTAPDGVSVQVEVDTVEVVALAGQLVTSGPQLVMV